MMTASGLLNLYIDANILLVCAFCLWCLADMALRRSGGGSDYAVRLGLVKLVLAGLALSPVLAHTVHWLAGALRPDQPLTMTDIAVAAYLRGDIAMPAVAFEQVLTVRGRLIQDAFAGAPLWAVSLAALLATGAIWQLSRLGRAIFSIRRAVRESHLIRRIGSIDIRVSDSLRVPYAARGLRRRYVILPSSLLARPRVLSFALTHELQHHRQSDVDWEILIEALRPLFFWNPAFWLWKRRIDHLRELSCDRHVMRTRRFAARDYAHGLLDFCEDQLATDAGTGLRVAFVRGGSARAKAALTTRILALHDAPMTRRGARLPQAMVAGVVVLGITLAATSVRQSADWSHDRLMLSTVVNLERLRGPGWSGF